MTIVFLTPIFFVHAQEELDSASNPFHAEINLIGKSYGDSIVLRWAPTTPGAWSYLNKVGYIIERVSFKNEQDFDPSEYQMLTSTPLKPLPLSEWESIVKEGPDQELSAIAAQALYGKSFNSTGNTLFDAADEFMNRYSFSMLGADLSIVTSNALGLRYSDKSVELEKHYIYRIFPASPPQNYSIDTAYLVLQNLRNAPIPVPIIDQVYEGEGYINFTWDKALHQSIFSAYIIERSENNMDFEPLTNIPFINPESDNVATKTTVFQYVDSVEENYKRFYYRLVGISPFGEKSQPSEVIEAMGRDRTAPSAPVNVEAQQIGEGIVEITWEVSEQAADLDGFYIGRGDDLDKNFQPLHDQMIPKDSTSYIDYESDKLGGNYYVVAAVDTAGNGSISMVSYAAVVDSIPPSPPVGFQGSIDSLGIVTLQWKLGEEIDLAGYMIYFSNSADHVFSTVNSAPLPDTIYTDTIQIKTLTRKVYYKLKSVDTRWNYSEYSGILELTRPDVIAPTTPVFSNYRLTKEGMWLEWIPSSSNDVSGYELEISKEGETVKRIFIEKRDQVKRYEYTYQNMDAGITYRFIVSTVDESGLRSAPSTPIQVTGIDLEEKVGIDDLTLTKSEDGKSISLNWSFHDADQIKRFVLYRSVQGSNFVTYKSIPPVKNSFNDTLLRKGINYDYSIKAIYASGKETPFSNIVSIKL